ncbi:MAG: polyketide cyclase [Alphaproteobacteria bacterium]|nr:polyketide cyclase [Alphaproteobacteria bacterium]
MRTILIIIAVAVLGVVGIALTKPDEFSVTRTATFDARVEKVFAAVNDLHQWEAWSPWAKLDPAAVTTYAGPQAGVGSSMAWNSEKGEVGVGKMTVTESVPGQKITLALDFEKPMKGTNLAEFIFKSEGVKTTVSWSMNGKANFMSKLMSVFMNCDKMVGEMFDQGLANLKAVVEVK